MATGDFTFNYGPRLISGAGSSRRIGELFDARRALFVTDRTILDLGLAGPALGALAAAGIEPVLFDAVESDPSLATVQAAEALGRESGVGAVMWAGV